MAYKDIAAELHLATGTIKSHMNQVYVKLGLDDISDRTKRRKVLLEDYYPVLSEESLPPPPPSAEEPKPVPPQVAAMVDEDERALVVWQPKPIASLPPRSVQVIDPKTP